MSAWSSFDRSKLPPHKLAELKRKEDEERTKEVYKEFVDTFERSATSSKTFIRGEIVQQTSSGRQVLEAKPAEKIYKPTSSILEKKEASFNEAKRLAEERARKIMKEVAGKHGGASTVAKRPSKTSSDAAAKKPSNLQQFAEEIKRLQSEREERKRIREQVQQQLGIPIEKLHNLTSYEPDDPFLNSYDNDPTTTNLFLTNLSPKITEKELCRLFGKFGPLGSVKIMWPRSDDERQRGFLTGFVAYMTRMDADRAMMCLKGKNVEGYEMRMGWGRPIQIPSHPVYIPDAMMELTLPPPPSGLPFNAQPQADDRADYPWALPPPGAPPPQELTQKAVWEKMISNAVVRVVAPTERPLLMLIHRMVEFVVREGPMFEAMIMQREHGNPAFRFLFDNQSPAHAYYRWKLYSILQGDSQSQWNTEDFRMFEGGSLWRPPPVNFFHQGMPKELVAKLTLDDIFEEQNHSKESSPASMDRSQSPSRQRRSLSRDQPRNYLTDAQRDHLEDILRKLTPERSQIANAMMYCVEHADAAEEIVDCIAESLSIKETPLPKKIARIYLIADILANCSSAKVLNVSYFRKFFYVRLVGIFKEIAAAYRTIEARLKAEQFKTRVMQCFRAWEDHALYPVDFLINLQNIFLGLTFDEVDQEMIEPIVRTSETSDADLDGVPLEEEAKPMISLVDYDLDGQPMESPHSGASRSPMSPRKLEDQSSKPQEETSTKFKPSKWEEVDPRMVEAQAMSTSKWDQLESKRSALSGLTAYGEDDEDIDGVPFDAAATSSNNLQSASTNSASQSVRSAAAAAATPLSEEKRAQLREIEMKVMQYQDDLESGRKKRAQGRTINELVDEYRQTLLDKAESEVQRNGSGTVSEGRKSKDTSLHRTSKKRRSHSRSRSRSRKRSKRRSRSKSKSRDPDTTSKSSRKRR